MLQLLVIIKSVKTLCGASAALLRYSNPLETGEQKKREKKKRKKTRYVFLSFLPSSSFISPSSVSEFPLPALLSRLSQTQAATIKLKRHSRLSILAAWEAEYELVFFAKS